MTLTCLLKGGLGNQLFQFSAAVNFALVFKIQLKFVWDQPKGATPRSFALDFLQISPGVSYLPALENGKLVLEKVQMSSKLTRNKFWIRAHSDSMVIEKNFHFNELGYVGGNITFDGWFQSFKYMEPNLSTIRDYILRHIYRLGFKDQKGLTSSILIHLRFGDYLVAPYNQTHENLTHEYYAKALKILVGDYNLDGLSVYYLSDDHNSAVKMLSGIDTGYRFQRLQGSSELEDLSSFLNFEKIVIANSSFSWWGAFLSSGTATIISPRSWFTEEVLRTKNICDLYPPNWILV